jgi:hypothetical protein
MTTAIRRRRGTTAQHSSFTGAAGETTIDTDKEVVVVHDGVQVGGYPLMRENGSNSALALGSAGTPSLKFTGDTNTGIYSPGADQVAISTNGTGRLFVDASGNVGVGAAPVVPLDIQQAQATQRLYSTTGTNTSHIQFRNTGGIAYVGLDSSTGGSFGAAYGLSLAHTGAYPITFVTNGLERMRLDSSGRLGLGTSSADRLLHVSAADTAYIRLENQDSTGSVDQYVGLIEFEGQDTGGSGVRAQIGGIYEGVSGATALVFGTSADADSVTERLRINRNGNVGIGTTDAYGRINVQRDSSNQFSTVSIGDFANADNSVGIYGRVGSSGLFGISTAGAPIVFYNGGSGTSEKARIDSSGRLLVGTSTSTNNTDSGDLQAIVRTGANAGGLSVVNYSGGNSANYPATFNLKRSRSTIDGTVTAFGALSGGWKLGEILFSGTDGTTFSPAASIASWTDGTAWSSGDTPGILTFSTTADGASSPTERLRIDSTGAISHSFAGTAGTAVDALKIVGSPSYLGANSEARLVLSPHSATRSVYISCLNTSSTNMDFVVGTSAGAAPVERLRITSAGVLQVADAGNITVGTTTGTKIGTATTQKIGFYNKTPVVQPTAVADATDAASVITQLNALLARMRDLGLIAT